MSLLDDYLAANSGAGWIETVQDSLTIPSDAIAGQARIYLSPNLPAPLNTYVTNVGERYKAAILIYGTGDDTTYTYFAVLDSGVLHIGQVASGSMLEYDTGIPAALMFESQPFGTRTLRKMYAESILLAATGNGPITIDGVSISLTAPSGITIVDNLIWGSPQSTTVDGTVDIATVSTTSTTFVNGGTVYGAAFVAPPSGMVTVSYYGRLQEQGAAGQSGFLAPQLRNGSVIGSGSIITPANDQDALRAASSAIAGFVDKDGLEVFYSGLTPGANYNVELLIRTTNAANQCGVNDRRAIVKPAL